MAAESRARHYARASELAASGDESRFEQQGCRFYKHLYMVRFSKYFVIFFDLNTSENLLCQLENFFF